MPEPQGRPTPSELVFAIAHEVGNHLGGIRLQAHLIDEDLDPRSLAEGTVAIDELAGRAGPLLALLRPILSGDRQAASGPSWSGLLRGLAQQLEDEGTRAVAVEIGVPDEEVEAALARAEGDWLHPLLMALLGATLGHVPARGSIRLTLEPRGEQAVLVFEDDGEAEDLSPEAALRGRGLVVAIARLLLGHRGGGVEAERVGDQTRVSLVFPARSDAREE